MHRSLIVLPACIVLILGVASPCVAGFGVDWRQGENLGRLNVSANEAEFELRSLNQIGGVYFAGEPVVIHIAAGKSGNALPEGCRMEAVLFHTGQFDPSDTGYVHGKAPRLIEVLGEPTTTAATAFKPDGELLRGVVGVPDTYGMYALILQRPDGQRTLIGAIARVLKPTQPVGDIPHIMSEYGLPQPLYVNLFNDDQICQALSRLGIRLVRREIGAYTALSSDEPVHSQYDGLFAAAEKYGIRVMVTVGVHQPETLLPWNVPGTGKPISWILPPAFDPQLQQWYANFARKYWRGGKDGFWGFEHWNEPWQPFGISGWGADTTRYRQILKAIHDGVKSVDPAIPVFAASSVMNTEDKLTTGPDDQFARMVDVWTDHYVNLRNSYGPRVAAKYGKFSGETETWGVHSQVLATQFLTQFLSGGTKFINPTQADMLWQGIGHDEQRGKVGPKGQKAPVTTPMPCAVTLAAWNAIVQDRPFHRMLFTTHLPFVFQFGPDDDAVFVISGKLIGPGSAGLKDNVWWQVHSGPNGSMRLTDPDGRLEVLDISGNVIPARAGVYDLTMDTRAYFLRAKAGANAVRDALLAGRIEGLRSVHIAPAGLRPDPEDPRQWVAPITFHNLLNRPRQASVSITVVGSKDQVAFDAPVKLDAGKIATVVMPLKQPPQTGLPLRIAFRPDDGPEEVWQELVCPVGIRRARMPVTGDDAAWQAIPVVNVLQSKDGDDYIESVWLPFAERGDKPDGTKRAELRMAWDDVALYLHATVDNPALQLKQRLSTWNQGQYFYGKALEEELRPLDRWAKFLAFRANDKKANEGAAQDPDWPAYQQFLQDNPGLARLAKDQYVRGIYTVKARRPDATLDEIAFHYCHFKPWFINDLPFSGDTFQFAFDIDKPEDYMTRTHDLTYPAATIPVGWQSVPDTDYEFAVYQCDDGYPEVWCLLAPGIKRHHYYPRQPRDEQTQHAVRTPASIEQRGERTVYRVAIPWNTLGIDAPKPGQDFGFTFRFNADSGGEVIFGLQEAATKMNGLTLHPYWNASPSNTIRWVLCP